MAAIKSNQKLRSSRRKSQSKKTIQGEMSKMKVWQLVLILIAVVGGGVLFVGAAAGWFNGSAKVVLSSEYDCADEVCGKMEDLSGEEYEALVNEKKSFVVFVDQAGCKTSGKLREYLTEYAKEKGFWYYRMMFEQVKETSMHEKVKFYPSVVVISRGEIVGFLRADSDEDADAYNNMEDFNKWLERYLP